ncbi:hypothetical protein J3L18_14740 [Mucilaginibacter gossypii]|uniref:hypothetical protein n=1 Tax=Mucilaginibacter gossypii TaxID=551996 RepID=UPI000DCCCCBA|nr:MULTISPECIES: hypothetical protein [Mucilaginibacter]QTE40254.1 hypothetical protein J3L18_14740 [Mucilaginibacter gossypii]RAV57537.1 hypothetical protein DIU36_11040 [Mucilaginibacter rubeus]
MTIKKGSLFVFFAVLLCTDVFSTVLIPSVFTEAGRLLLIVMMIVTIAHTKKEDSFSIIKAHFNKEVTYLIVIVVLGLIPAYLFHGQNFYISIWVVRPIFFWLLYKYLHIKKYSPTLIINEMFKVGLMWGVVVIMQQRLYPTIYFNQSKDNTDEFLEFFAQTRGVIRLSIAGFFVGFFVALETLSQLLNKVKFIKMAALIAIIVGVFFTGSRQYLGILLFAIVLTIFYSRNAAGKRSVSKIFFLLITIVFIVVIKYDYITSLINVSSDDLSAGDSYIRFIEMHFYLLEYWPNWLTVLMGNGWEHSSSPYGKEIYSLWMKQHYFREDVGIIGGLNKFGIFYAFIVFKIIYKVVFKIKLPKTRVYIRYFFVLTFLLYFAAQDWFSYLSSVPVFAIALYLVDCYNLEYTENQNVPVQTQEPDLKAISNV